MADPSVSAAEDFRAFCIAERRERLRVEMQEVGGLFAQGDALPLEPKPKDNGSPTSLVAALKVWPKIKGQKRRILDLLARTPAGLTRNEIAEILNLSKDSVNGRVHELLELRHYVIERGVRDDRAVLFCCAEEAEHAA